MIDSNKIVAYLTKKREFRVFNTETRQLIDTFQQVVPNSPPRQLATCSDSPTKIAYTQNKVLVLLDLSIKDQSGKVV